jgi:hypothetical protein
MKFNNQQLTACKHNPPGMRLHANRYTQSTNICKYVIDDIMKKDKTIKKLLQHLQDKFGSTNIIISDNWDADLCAIGILDKSQRHLAYISTFNCPDNHFFISLENKSDDNNCSYNVAGEFNDMTIFELEIIIAKHLKL